MKYLLLVFLCLTNILFCDNISVQARVGYFYPYSPFVRKIYHKNHRIEYEFEGAYLFCNPYSVWVNFNSYNANGHSKGLKEGTSIYIRPFSVGFKYDFVRTRNANLYAGAGLTYTRAKTHEHQHTEDIDRHVQKSEFGGVIKSGVLMSLPYCFIADLFADYYFTKLHTVRGFQNVGGLRVGLGIGTSF